MARQNPIRIVADSFAYSFDTPLVTTAKEAPTWVFSDKADTEKEKQLIERGVTVNCTGSRPRVDLAKAMKHLAENGILSVLLEGGGGLNWSMLESKLVGKVVSFIAPKLLGSKETITPISGRGFERMALAVELENVTVKRFGEDICIIGYPKY